MKRKINLIWNLTLAVLTVINIIIAVSGYIFCPDNELLFLIICILFMFAGAVISRKCGQEGKYRWLMPVLSATVLASSAFILEIGRFYVSILVIAAIEWMVIVTYPNMKSPGRVMAMGCLSTLVCIILTCIVAFENLFGSFGMITNEEFTYSPDGTRLAWVRVSDQGALGGSTIVYVRENKDKFVLMGTLKKLKIEVCRGRFSDNRELEWKDNNVLLVDGEEYVF